MHYYTPCRCLGNVGTPPPSPALSSSSVGSVVLDGFKGSVASTSLGGPKPNKLSVIVAAGSHQNAVAQGQETSVCRAAHFVPNTKPSVPFCVITNIRLTRVGGWTGGAGGLAGRLFGNEVSASTSVTVVHFESGNRPPRNPKPRPRSKPFVRAAT